MSCSRNKHIFRCDQNGPPARRSEPDWQLEGAYLNRYVTDEQRSRRPIFIATLRAAISWLFFRVARSARIDLDMLVATASPARTALKNSQLTCGERHAYFGNRTLARRLGLRLHPITLKFFFPLFGFFDRPLPTYESFVQR